MKSYNLKICFKHCLYMQSCINIHTNIVKIEFICIDSYKSADKKKNILFLFFNIFNHFSLQLFSFPYNTQLKCSR